MWRELFSGGGLFILPVIAMVLFLAIFITVILRVCQRSRRAEYERMASLPLDDRSVVRTRESKEVQS